MTPDLSPATPRPSPPPPAEHDPPGVAHLCMVDPVLARAIDGAGPLTLRRPAPVYDELVRAVLNQQLGGAAATSIERRFRALFRGQIPQPAQLATVPDEALRGAGLSRQKIRYLRDLAERTAEGSIGDHLRDLPDAEVVAAVTAVHGIGRWTADMLLIFCLQRPDVLPVDDLGIRKGMQRLYNLPALPGAAEMERIAAPWRPFRSTATHYLWQVVDSRALETRGRQAAHGRALDPRGAGR